MGRCVVVGTDDTSRLSDLESSRHRGSAYLMVRKSGIEIDLFVSWQPYKIWIQLRSEEAELRNPKSLRVPIRRIEDETGRFSVIATFVSNVPMFDLHVQSHELVRATTLVLAFVPVQVQRTSGLN